MGWKSRRKQRVQDTSYNFGMIYSNARYAFELAWQNASRLLIINIVMVVITSILPVAQIAIFRWIVNDVIDATRVGYLTDSLKLLLSLFMIILFLQVVMQLAKQYVNHLFSKTLQLNTSVYILEHASKIHVSNFDHPDFQDTLERTRGDVSCRVISFIQTTLSIVSTVVEMIGILAILVTIQPIVTVLVILIALPYICYNNQLTKVMYEINYQRSRKRRWLSYFSNLMLSRRSVFEVALLNLAPLLIERYRTTTKEFLDEDEAIFRRKLMLSAIFGISSVIINVGLAVWVISLVTIGSLTVGDIAVYIGAFTRLKSNIDRFSSSSSSFLEQVLYIEDYAEFMDIPVVEQHPDTVAMPKIKGDIRLENLSFVYPGSHHRVLKNLSLHIKAGEIVAIVGHNGAGKSTLVKLISGIYQPTSGRILIDDVPSEQIELKELYSHITFFMQEYNRYEGTIHENISYGNWEKLLDDKATVQKIVERAELNEFIDELPEQYDTLVGRLFGTVDLSGGQWQKLSLARTFTREASIVILDEPSSQLDPLAEYNLFKKLRNLIGNKTAIMISHRFSTVIHADRIIVLDNGEVLESGTHEELIALNGTYAQLCRLQQISTEDSSI